MRSSAEPSEPAASPLAYKASNLSAEDRLTVTLEISFEERQSGRILWSDSAFSGTGDYPVTTVGVTETSRKNALIKLANDTAERAYRLMMSGFLKKDQAFRVLTRFVRREILREAVFL